MPYDTSKAPPEVQAAALVAASNILSAKYQAEIEASKTNKMASASHNLSVDCANWAKVILETFCS